MKEATFRNLACEAIEILKSIANKLDELRILHEAAVTEQSEQLSQAA